MDLLHNYKGRYLKEFMNFMNSNNFVTQPTREALYRDSVTGRTWQTKTLIDVVLHNKADIKSVYNVNYPDSDHKIILTYLNVNNPISDVAETQVSETKFILNDKSYENINEYLKTTINDFIDTLSKVDNIDEKWLLCKNYINNAIKLNAKIA